MSALDKSKEEFLRTSDDLIEEQDRALKELSKISKKLDTTIEKSRLNHGFLGNTNSWFTKR